MIEYFDFAFDLDWGGVMAFRIVGLLHDECMSIYRRNGIG